MSFFRPSWAKFIGVLLVLASVGILFLAYRQPIPVTQLQFAYWLHDRSTSFLLLSERKIEIFLSYEKERANIDTVVLQNKLSILEFNGCTTAQDKQNRRFLTARQGEARKRLFCLREQIKQIRNGREPDACADGTVMGGYTYDYNEYFCWSCGDPLFVTCFMCTNCAECATCAAGSDSKP